MRLKGFKGISSGFGRDEITLDLESLVGDAQLVALVGPNGKGKSTILDNLHPWRLMPSRASSPTPAAFSYWDQIHGPECVKELEWSHQGRRYRSTLVFRNSGKTRKAEAFLHELDDSGLSRPAALDNGAVSDGKSETYDAVLTGILGKPEMFFTSIFTAQNRKPLSACTDSEIKSLLAELLGLERIREIGARASQTAKLLGAGLTVLRGQLNRLTQLEAQHLSQGERITALQQQAAQAQAQRQQAQAAMLERQNEAARIRAARDANADVDKRRQALQNELSLSMQARLNQAHQHQHDVKREQQHLQHLLDAAKQQDLADDKQRREAQAQIVKLNTVLSRRMQIEAAAAQLGALQQQEAQHGQGLEAARAELEQLNALRTERADLAARLKGLADKGALQRRLCDGLQSRAQLKASAPCDSALQQRCPLLRDAVAAAASLPAAQQEVSVLRDEYATLNKAIAELDARIKAQEGVPARIQAAETMLRKIRADIAEQQALALLAPQLQEAQGAIASLQERVAEIDAAVKQRAQQLAIAKGKTQETVAELEQREAKAGQAAQLVQQQIQADINALPPPFDVAVLTASESAVAQAASQVSACETRLDQIKGEIAAAQAQADAVAREIAAGAEVKDKIASVDAALAQWTLLSSAFSNNGIVALSIDDAGPALTGVVNDLLLACYGNRFTVEIKTQVATSKGELREGFEILVHDADRNESKSVGDMSGGERVWINEALVRGIALYLARESGGFDTLFSDEADGPLDPQRKAQYFAMKREVLRLGGYQREFFISQSPDIWAMADVRIDLETL